MIHPTAIIHKNASIESNVDIWSNAVICENVIIRFAACIGSNCYIGKGSTIGAYSRLQHGVFLPNGSRLGESVFIGPNVTCTDDRYPRVGNHNYQAEPPHFQDGCSIGAGSVILPGITIGENAMVGAGCVVIADVPKNAVVVGNPSRIIRIKGEQDASRSRTLAD